MRLATYNIHRGFGRDRRQDLDRVAAVLGEMEADVLALQEVDSDPTEEGVLDHLAHLAAATGFHAVTGPTLRRKGSAYGNLLLCRARVGEVAHLDLCVAGCEPRAAIDAVVATNDGEIRVLTTHLGLRPRERRQQITRLMAQLRPRGSGALGLQRVDPLQRDPGLRRAGTGDAARHLPARAPSSRQDLRRGARCAPPGFCTPAAGPPRPPR